MKYLLKLTVCVIICAVCAGSKGLPSYLQLCHRKDPQLYQCVLKNVDLLRKKVTQGIPELFVPPLSPLVIPEASLQSGDNFHATFKNIQIYHAETFSINHLNFDLEKFHVDLNVTFPRLRIKSIYSVKGRILILTLNGQGPADGNFTNVVGGLSLKGKEFLKKDKHYVKWEKERISLDVGRPHFLFENIFGNNTELNERTNQIINDNIEDIVEELKPVVSTIVTDFLFSIVNRLFSRYSLDELFPN